jgi:hypothetical protein
MTDNERAVLGAGMQGIRGHSGVLSLADEDFAHPRHKIIAAAMRDMIRQGQHVDVLTIGNELAARGKLSSPGGAGGNDYLHGINSQAPLALNADYYAGEVRKEARHRIATERAQQLIERLGREDSIEELPAILTSHTDQMSLIPNTLEDITEELPTLRRLLAQEDSPEDWLIPGLLERGERVVITGGEGGGKSTLLKQLVVSFAGGLNPWNGVRVADGMRVLYLDAELSSRQNRRNYRWIAASAKRRLMAPDWDERIFHYVRNDGLDLPGRDREWFHHVAAQTSPDVIVVGPAYKCMAGDEKSDVDVMNLLKVLDEVRVKHDAALIVEAHSPHGDEDTRPIRPIGSSVWLRWPEIGFGFRRDKDPSIEQMPTPHYLKAISWRGQREERDWPDLIRRGIGNEFPWVPTREKWQPSIDLGYSLSNEMSA